MAKRDLDFLFEVGTLRHVPRAWQQVLSGRAQNIAEHIFRMTIIAWVIASTEKADSGKVLKMCLLHDMPESRATDIAFMHRGYVTRNEELAGEHIFKETALEKESRALLKEYEERKTLESKIVKDADNLEVDLELKELAKIGDTTVLDMQQMRREIRAKKLYTKTAKKMWDDIQKADPNAWHHTLVDAWVKNKNSAK